MDDIKQRELELAAVDNLMKSEYGRAFMMRYLHKVNTYGTVFDRDTHQHTYNSAQRECGLMLEAELKEASPDNYFKMIKESL